VRPAGRPPRWLARAAVVALLVGAALPLLALALSPADPGAPAGGPGLVALSSALEKAHRCLQGDGRTSVDPFAPSPVAVAGAPAAPALAAPPSPAPAAPSVPRDAALGAVEAVRRE
jgi:hypothetical protein